MTKEVYIVSAVRTPIGSYLGALSEVSAANLGAAAIKEAVKRAGMQPAEVEEVFMGNVLTANTGQAPARQAALYAGLSNKVSATTINKVCASGAKSIVLAAQAIMLGDRDIVVAGGMESMSNAPHYIGKARKGYGYGNAEMTDAIIKDGLWDVYNNTHMGNCAEKCAKDYDITREQQDAHAIESYQRSAKAWETGKFTNEIVAIEIVGKKGTVTVNEDEDYKKVFFDKIPTLKPVFDNAGSVTAANASNINDGASALVLMSKEKADMMGIKPLAIIKGYADNEQEPENFTTAPVGAIQKAVKKAGITLNDVSYFEINEAFSVVSIANNQLLNISNDKVNIYGGAVALGHPIGSSGSRIMVTLLSVLHQEGGKFGVIGICNGGGGSTAIVVEAVN
ncbi:MAG: acetyl-CoA C-acyltransferase [Bacteroidota bacterium]|nr:acetyl-CoA C-acyltransferase [Bacteroidota bacterium]